MIGWGGRGGQNLTTREGGAENQFQTALINCLFNVSKTQGFMLSSNLGFPHFLAKGRRTI